jgi:hypothetical protein
MRRFPAVALLALCFLSGCDTFAVQPDATVHAFVRPDGVELHNQTGRAAFVFAADDRYVPALNWTPCLAGEHCLRLDRGERRILPFERILVFSERTSEIRLFWWHAAATSSGVRPTPPTSRTLPVPR